MAQQIVNSYTEWDPLEEVVVGRLSGGVFPTWQPSMRAMGSTYRIHRAAVNDPYAMHIDATIVSLVPGKLLVNPERYVPHDLFRGWEILEAPKPTLPTDWPMYLCSLRVSMNVLSLDEQTVVVERHEEPLIETLRDWVSAVFRGFPTRLHLRRLLPLRDSGCPAPW